MRTIKNIAYYFGALVLSRGFGLVQSFLLARILDPENFGVWVTLILLISYGPIFSLGTVETLLKQVPYFHGRNEIQEMHEVENGVLGSIILSALFAIFLAILAPLVIPLVSWNIPPMLMVTTLLAIAAGYFSAFFYYRFSAYENFKMNGLMDALRATIALVLISFLSWAWGIRGAAVGYLLHELCMCFLTRYFSTRLHGRVGVSFKPDLLIRVIRIGFPITVLWWVFILTFGVDRMVLGSMVGAVAVGHYGLGMSVAGILGLVPMVVGRVLYPKVNKQFGKEADPEAMKRLVVAPTLALGTLLVNLQVPLLVMTPFLYDVLLPKYRPGLLAGQILILGTFFASMLRNGANFLIATNQERPFLMFIVTTLVFNLIADVTLVKAGIGIEGVAVGTSLAGVLLNSLVWSRVLTRLNLRGRQWWEIMAGLNLPIILLMGTLGCLLCVSPQIFRTFSISSILGGALTLVAVNLMLYMVPMYRDEMAGWKSSLLQVGASIKRRIRVVA